MSPLDAAVIRRLGRHGIISAALAEQIAPSAGLRKRLVHQYNALDDRKVWEAIGQAQHIFPAYIQVIESFLIRSGL